MNKFGGYLKFTLTELNDLTKRMNKDKISRKAIEDILGNKDVLQELIYLAIVGAYELQKHPDEYDLNEDDLGHIQFLLTE